MLVVGCASGVAAQSTDRSALEGKVVDQSGAVLPGVTVTLASPAILGSSMVETTDIEGHYRFAALPIGTYAASFELTGFQGIKREGLRLTAGFVAVVNVTMQVGSVAETITVPGQSPVVDVRTTAVSTSFNQEVLESVPTSRSVWQILTLSPGVRVGGTPDVGGSLTGVSSAFTNFGSAAGGNRSTIDGIASDGPAGCSGIYSDFGAYAEIQIKAMGNDAEMPVAGTNVVGVLKSGGNQFHGTGIYQWEGTSLQSSNLDAALQAAGVTFGNPLISYYDRNADLGGRIVRDRLWFYGAGHWQKIENSIIGFPIANLITVQNYSAKVTAQLTSKQKFVWFDQFNIKDFPYNGANALTPPISTVHQHYTPNLGKGEWTYNPTGASLLSILVGRAAWASIYNPAFPDSGPSTLDTSTLQNGGTTLINNNSHSYRARWQQDTTYSYFKSHFLGGDHNFKAGFELQKDSYTRDILDRGAAGNYQTLYTKGVPFEVITYNDPFTSYNNQTNQSGYLQDSWRIGDRLTINGGVRFERYHVFLPAQSKPASTFNVAASYPATDLLTWNAAAPRLGVSYALTSDNRTVFKATYGRFNWPARAEDGLNYNKNNLLTTTYRWSDPNGNGVFDPNELGAFVSASGAGYTVLNPDLIQPRTYEYTATVERELMQNLSTRFSYVYKVEDQQYQLVNIARPYSAYNTPIAEKDPVTGAALTVFDYDAAYRGASFVSNENINTPGYQNTYHNLEVVFDKRLSKRWQMLTSYLATKRNVFLNTAAASTQFGVGITGYTGVPQDPNTANFYPKDETWEQVFKISGSYLLPHNIQAAASYTQTSGVPFARTASFTNLPSLGSVVLNMEPTGAERYPTQRLLALRGEKRFKLGPTQAAVQFDVFNALNTNVATSQTIQSGANFGKILAIIPPRVARVGVRFTF